MQFYVYDVAYAGMPPEARHLLALLIDERGQVYASAELAGAPGHVVKLAQLDNAHPLYEAGHAYLPITWLRLHVEGDALRVVDKLEADGRALHPLAPGPLH